MNYFLNYSVNTGLSVRTSRDPNASVGDIEDVVIAVGNENEDVSCTLDGAKDVLEDGSYWNGSDVTIEAIEEVHSFITEWEASQARWWDQ